MKTRQCNVCKVQVDVALHNCPLCGKYLGKPEAESISPYPIPEYLKICKIHERKAFFIFVSLSLFAILLAGLINVVVEPQQAWSIYAILGISYLWILIGHTIISKSTVGQKMIYQTLAISVFLVTVDILTMWQFFSVTYIIPLLIAAMQLAMLIIIWSSENARRHDLMNLLLLILFGTIPMILYWTNFITIWWPSLVSILTSMLTFLLLIIVDFKAIWSDIKGKIHL